MLWENWDRIRFSRAVFKSPSPALLSCTSCPAHCKLSVEVLVGLLGWWDLALLAQSPNRFLCLLDITSPEGCQQSSFPSFASSTASPFMPDFFIEKFSKLIWTSRSVPLSLNLLTGRAFISGQL